MTSAYMEKEVEYGVFMPVGEGGWIRSTTAPPVPATYAYNRQVAILAEQIGLDFLLVSNKVQPLPSCPRTAGVGLLQPYWRALLAETSYTLGCAWPLTLTGRPEPPLS